MCPMASAGDRDDISYPAKDRLVEGIGIYPGQESGVYSVMQVKDIAELHNVLPGIPSRCG